MEKQLGNSAGPGSRLVPSLSLWGRLGRRGGRARRALRRNRVLLVALLAVGGVVAALTGISLAGGNWFPQVGGPDSQPPDARYGAATAWDPKVVKGMILFGGFVGGNIQAGVSGPPFANDGKTWSYKGSTWRNENPIHSPSPRGFSAMVYDRARQNVVLFGGGRLGTNTVFGDTWIYDGKDWIEQHPPEPLPEPRQNHAMVYNRHRQLVFMFGGKDAAGAPMNDAWVWDGSSWKILPNEGAPPRRWGHAMAYDTCNAEVVMFGGIGLADASGLRTHQVETWTYNGDSWTSEDPPLPPTGRIGASMEFSATSGRVLMYGGLSTNEAGVSSVAHDPDVWRWDGAGKTWAKMNSDVQTVADTWCSLYILCDLAPRQTPPPRAYLSWATSPDPSDGGDQGFVMYGGTPASSVAFADYYFFGENRTFNAWEQRQTISQEAAQVQEDLDLVRYCAEPVPLPAGEGEAVGASVEKAPEAAIRSGVREIETGQSFQVLTGEPWPGQSRDTHNYNKTPNPNYFPAPDCPNRPGGEIGSNTFLVTDKERNRIYQFFFCDYYRGRDYLKGQGGEVEQRVMRLLIQVHDGTTLKPLAKVIADPVSIEDFYLGFAGNFHDNYLFHDAGRGLFYLRTKWQYTGKSGETKQTFDEWAILSQDLIEQGKDPLVERRNFKISASPGSSTPIGGALIATLYTHPTSGRPKLLVNRASAATPTAPGVPTISQFDFETQTVDWDGLATGCAALGTNKPMRSGNNVYVACSGSINGSNRHGVVRIPLEVKPDGSETPGTAQAFAGPFNVSQSWADPEAERLMLFSSFGGTQVWVFDGKTSRFVGFAGITNGYGNRVFGFDKEIGRLYIHMTDEQGFVGGTRYKDQGGLLLLDARLTPVPQVIKFPEFAFPSWIPIATLRPGPGVPRRVILRQVKGTMRKYPDGELYKFDNQMFYRILADEVRVPNQAEISDLDSLTLGIPESPGKTEAFFDAEGSGYGTRLRSVGGVYSAAMPFQQAYEHGYTSLAEGFATHELVTPLWPACVFPDRELMTGWVQGARLSDLDAAARSSGLEVDSNSKVDLEGASSRCNPTLDPSKTHPNVRPVFSVLWPLWQTVQLEGNEAVGPLLAWDQHFKQVECVGDSLQESQATVGNIYGSANCVRRQGLVEATARGSATGGGPVGAEASEAGFSVAEGYSNVKVTRDPEKGVVVTTVAVARGIEIPGLSIDRVETEAVAWSNGRPSDTERATFVRRICGVRTPDYSNSRCLTAAEQKQFVDGWNNGWKYNSQMYLPTPDPVFYKGSPGGYIVGVIKPLGDEIEDQLFAKDYQKEVPGLVVEFYKDSYNRGRQRQALMLAATRAVAGFGVQCHTDLVYSATANGCIDLTFEDDPVELEEEFIEEEEFSDDADLDTGEWTPLEAAGAPGESLGSQIGRLLDRLPIVRRLPIREMGEALLASSVWLLLVMPLYLASRRFALTRGGTI